MARIPAQKLELWQALSVVMDHTRKERKHWQEEIEKPTPPGWDRERHIKYCQRQLTETIAAANWVQVQMMRINPD